MRWKEEDCPDTPTILKSLPILKWLPAFEDHLSRCVGVRDIPLSYVIRPDAAVPAALLPLQQHQPHATDYGSIVNKLVARASHNHAAYVDDNEEVYFMVKEATRGTQYAATIRSYTRAKNG